MTKIIVISNKSDITSDFIIKALKIKQIPFYRFNTEELTKSIYITLDFDSDSFKLYDSNLNQTFDLKDFTGVYYRRPELPSINDYGLTDGEIQFLKNEIIYTLEGVYKLLRRAYWVSPLFSIREAENKIYQLEIAKSLGLKIPNSIITNDYNLAFNFYEDNNKNCIIKPIKSGLIEDVNESKVVFTNFIETFPTETNKLTASPTYFQSHILKKGDIRVIAVGNKIFATFIESQDHINTKTDWRKGEIKLVHRKINLPSEIERKCNLLLRSLKLRYGAIDFILNQNDEYVFLEINPNGQWAWIEKQTDYKITDAIVNLLQNETF